MEQGHLTLFLLNRLAGLTEPSAVNMPINCLVRRMKFSVNQAPAVPLHYFLLDREIWLFLGFGFFPKAADSRVILTCNLLVNCSLSFLSIFQVICQPFYFRSTLRWPASNSDGWPKKGTPLGLNQRSRN